MPPAQVAVSSVDIIQHTLFLFAEIATFGLDHLLWSDTKAVLLIEDIVIIYLHVHVAKLFPFRVIGNFTHISNMFYNSNVIIVILQYASPIWLSQRYV